MLSVSLDCPFLIVPSVFSYVYVPCTLCYQFLWIVHFWLHLRYSLTFLLTGVSVQRLECELSCICVLGVSILFLSSLFLFDFGIGPTMWYLFVFHFMIWYAKCFVYFKRNVDGHAMWFNFHFHLRSFLLKERMLNNCCILLFFTY